MVGYLVIATVLLPLYYRLNLTSIYQYLQKRFGEATYKSGAVLFLLSRIIGASLRLYLVAMVLQLAICEPLGIPFEVTVFVSIALIYLYTFRGGIKTVVWTDTLQTFCMLLAAGLTVYLVASELNWSFGEVISNVSKSEYSQIFFWDWQPGNFFFKQFISGAFIAIVMTGLDQDMMQKNLTCRSLGDAQKNMFWFSVVLVFANLLFLGLGALLFIYGNEMGILQEVFSDDCKIMIKDVVSGEMVCQATDKLFPILSIDYLGPVAGVIFILGVVAAAYSSADSALTALTTSFCVDILNFESRTDDEKKTKTRYLVHIAFAFLLFLAILVFEMLNNEAVIWAVFTAAGYTYGPLLGLYVFGLFTKIEIRDKWAPYVCIVAPIVSYGIQLVMPMLTGYTFGFEILLLNGVLTLVGLWLIKKPA
jgi:Na+/proline symporter